MGMMHRGSRWWWVMVVMVMTRGTWAGAQKIETDGLEQDNYNLRDNAEDEQEYKTKDGSKSKLKYTVTEEVYLDITIANTTALEKPYSGRITIACFGEITPITCLNFVALAKGYKVGRDLLIYKGTPVHRIVKDFVVQMGDVTGKKGKSGKSIYGESFHDENFKLSHQGPGWVSMANHGRDTNGSQFFIMLQSARWLDGKHVVFGKVIKGMETLRRLGDLPTTVTSRPRVSVKIEDSGVVGIPSKYELSEKDVMSNDDITK